MFFGVKQFYEMGESYIFLLQNEPPPPKKQGMYLRRWLKSQTSNWQKNDIHLSEKKSVPPQQLQKQMQENKV